MSQAKPIFKIQIWQGAHDLGAVVLSEEEGKATPLRAPTMKTLLDKINKAVKRRRSHLRRFPAPEPSLIVTLDQSIKPSQNGH